MCVGWFKVSGDRLENFECTTLLCHYKLLDIELAISVSVIISSIFIEMAGLYRLGIVDMQG